MRRRRDRISPTGINGDERNLQTRGDFISVLIKSSTHFFSFVNPFFKNSLTFFQKKRAKSISKLGSFLNLMTLPLGLSYFLSILSYLVSFIIFISSSLRIISIPRRLSCRCLLEDEKTGMTLGKSSQR